MAENSAIEWTDATWTPIRARNKATGKVGWHCEHASPGCKHCYSESFNEVRLGTGLPFKPGHRDDVEHFLDEAMLLAPLRWRRPRRIFVCSMTDLFGEWVPDAWIDRIFAVMALCPQHTFQVLTKRSARMRAYIDGRIRMLCGNIGGCAVEIMLEHTSTTSGEVKTTFPQRANEAREIVLARLRDGALPNVWLGVSAEDQDRANQRVPDLLATPAAVRFVSAEPLLGPILFEEAWHGDNALDSECWGECAWCENGHPPLHNCQRGKGDWEKGRSGLDWIIVGGESGPNARPMHPEWARLIRDECAAAGVPFHYKQAGAWAALDGDDGEWPSDAGSLIRLRWDGSRGPDGHPMQRVGKKAAGRLLDGVEHNAMPEIAR